jgi:predicted transcriptional regulator
MHERIAMPTTDRSQLASHQDARVAFREDGVRAWTEYQATSLHVTAKEADAWLAKLEAGKDVEPPECHV